MNMASAMSRALAFLVFLLVASCSQDVGQSGSSADAERMRLEERAARVEIIRDDFGVPHIYGKTDADAVFGMLVLAVGTDLPELFVAVSASLGSLRGEHEHVDMRIGSIPADNLDRLQEILALDDGVALCADVHEH